MNRTGILGFGLCSLMLAASAQASVFYIDQFQINKFGNAWFVDTFSDGVAPPSSEGTFPSGAPGNYLTLPTPLPGPEAGGKLALDTAQGADIFSSVTGLPLKYQRARLQTDVSTDLGPGLKTDDIFQVYGLFDLIEPTSNSEGYGIRLADFLGTNPNPNDNVMIRVVKTSAGAWEVQWAAADYLNSVFNILDSYALTGVGAYDQILLTLSKDLTDSNLISASFVLVDLNGPNMTVNMAQTAAIFTDEVWTRAEFFAFAQRQVVPVPATLLLFAAGLLGLAHRHRRHRRPA